MMCEHQIKMVMAIDSLKSNGHAPRTVEALIEMYNEMFSESCQDERKEILKEVMREKG